MPLSSSCVCQELFATANKIDSIARIRFSATLSCWYAITDMLIVKENRYLSLSCSIKYQFNEASLREGFQQQWGRTGEENCRKI